MINGFLFRKKLPLWSWECINERCVPIQAVNSIKLQSLTTCNMLCAAVQLWPHPTGAVSLSTTAVPVRTDLFHLQDISAPSKAVHEHLKEAFQIFLDDLHQIELPADGFTDWRAVAVHINVNGSNDPRMKIDTDESYSLQLQHKRDASSAFTVDIKAISFCGAIHGLETLLQLVWFDPTIGSLMMLKAAKVNDAPKFRYRGLMLDTARKYYPLKDLLRTIDAMGACKLNTFHWHISDSQAFPLKLASVPQLALNGASGSGAVYSRDDVRKVVRRARLRGIRVLIEVDVPAHVGHAWKWRQSESLGDVIFCIDSEPWTAYCNNPPCGQLNPRNPHVYEVLEAIYGEIVQLTGVDDIFHLGGSQISARCWEENINDTDAMDLWLEFTRQALQRLQVVNGKLPNITLLWASHLTEHMKSELKDYVHSLGLQARSTEWSQKYMSGIRTVISYEDSWDLNSGMGAWYEDVGGTPYNSWQRIYEHRPWSRWASRWIHGGEATVWSSSLGQGGLDAHIWPRAAALAERLWSDRAEGATRLVQARLDVHRSRLIVRGIQAAPLWSMWFTHNSYTCN